ncbi:MAG: N-acyl-D-amino-acid deacylase family protein [Myxococcota bacterium]
MGTTLLSNGRIVDGSGEAAFDGHVLLEGDRIAEVIRGEARPAADRVIDAGGRVVAPGFVDMHSHADFLMPRDDHDRLVRSFLEQGVTTVVAGNCGISPAPVRGRTRARLEGFASIAIDKPLPWSWESMGEYLDVLDAARPAVNVAQLVGHAALRYAATDSRRGAMDASDVRRCEEATRAAFDQGACGLSFGLGYDPGMYSPLDELEAFSRVAASAGKTVTAHLKAYSWLSPTYPLHHLRPHNLRAIREMLEVTRRARARLQISHFIFVGRHTWRTAGRALELVDDARARGQDVMIDAFPYTCGNTTVNVSLPYWFLAMGPEAYRSRAARARLRLELELGYRLVGFRWEDFQVMQVGVDGWEELDGLTVAELGRRWGIAPFDAFLRVAEASRGSALMLLHSYSGDPAGRGPIEDVIAHEACLFETDAIARSDGWPNPATMGAFPKILARWVRETGRIRLEDAVRRMTAASLERFGITDRGRVARGQAADLVVFDPDTIADTPPAPGRPAGRPRGIAHVFVNGAQVVEDGVHLPDRRHGRTLRA